MKVTLANTKHLTNLALNIGFKTKVDALSDVLENEQHLALIRIIKKHQLSKGWTLLIPPDHLPKKEILIKAGVDLGKVLIIHKKHCHDVLFKAYRSLKQDNFSALVIWDNLLNQTEIDLLKIKSEFTPTSLYILDNNNHDQLDISH